MSTVPVYTGVKFSIDKTSKGDYSSDMLKVKYHKTYGRNLDDCSYLNFFHEMK